MYKTFPTLLALMLLLAGCTTTSSPKGKSQFAPTNIRQATIYVFDEIPGVVGTDNVVVANGTPIGPISRRQYTWFYTRPGTLDLSIYDRQHDGRLLASERFPVRAGRSYYIRYRMVRYERSVVATDGLSKDVSVVPVVHVLAGNLEEVPESEGIELAGTHRLVDTYAPTTVVRESSRRHRADFK
ncbi:MAG: hypothetical protein EOP84_13625 [Verrucomicrobiaceae bacterium]|nr:MAG: hypothetical protein EOP84_13625 [Verrucomicrobiaceae bacterium]